MQKHQSPAHKDTPRVPSRTSPDDEGRKWAPKSQGRKKEQASQVKQGQARERNGNGFRHINSNAGWSVTME